MKKITIWLKLNTKTNEFEHNHIEDGHQELRCPIAKFSTQRDWKGEE